METFELESIKEIMTKRNYHLYATSGDNKILHYGTPVEEKPHICCDVFINNYVEFKFRYITKKCIMLTTDNIGSFFDDNHFNKFEVDFWNLATALYNFEYNNKGE